MLERRGNPRGLGEGVGSSAEYVDAAPWEIQLSPWAVGAEKLFAALDVRQDHASTEGHCVSPAPVNVHCQDLGLGNVPMGDSPRKRTVDHTPQISIPPAPSQIQILLPRRSSSITRSGCLLKVYTKASPVGCPPSSEEDKEHDKGMRDAKWLIRRNWGVLCWRSGLSHLTSPSLLPCSTGLLSPAAPETHHTELPSPAWSLWPGFWPNLPHHSNHPPQTTGEIPKPSPVPRQLMWLLSSCPFFWEGPDTSGRNPFSSRKCQFIKTLPQKRSLQTTFSFQKPSGKKN